MVKPFNGKGDIEAWITKVELVCTLTNVKEEAKVIPFYLEGRALVIYMEVSNADKLVASEIKAKLMEAYSDSLFVAYGKLISYPWTEEESVDVYAKKLRRLAGMAGFKANACERLVKLSFCQGMPNDVGVELQQIMNIKTIEIEHVISRARILVANMLEPVIAASGIRLSGAAKEQSHKTQVGVSRNNQADFKGSNRKCFRYGGPHMIRSCPERGEKHVVVCYTCNGEGRTTRIVNEE